MANWLLTLRLRTLPRPSIWAIPLGALKFSGRNACPVATPRKQISKFKSSVFSFDVQVFVEMMQMNLWGIESSLSVVWERILRSRGCEPIFLKYCLKHQKFSITCHLDLCWNFHVTVTMESKNRSKETEEHMRDSNSFHREVSSSMTPLPYNQ